MTVQRGNLAAGSGGLKVAIRRKTAATDLTATANNYDGTMQVVPLETSDYMPSEMGTQPNAASGYIRVPDTGAYLVIAQLALKYFGVQGIGRLLGIRHRTAASSYATVVNDSAVTVRNRYYSGGSHNWDGMNAMTMLSLAAGDEVFMTARQLDPTGSNVGALMDSADGVDYSYGKRVTKLSVVKLPLMDKGLGQRPANMSPGYIFESTGPHSWSAASWTRLAINTLRAGLDGGGMTDLSGNVKRFTQAGLWFVGAEVIFPSNGGPYNRGIRLMTGANADSIAAESYEATPVANYGRHQCFSVINVAADDKLALEGWGDTGGGDPVTTVTAGSGESRHRIWATYLGPSS